MGDALRRGVADAQSAIASVAFAEGGDVVPRRSRFDAFALLFGPCVGALLSLWLGLSTNWDLRNYHWYNAYALLHGRHGFDVAVAHHATYYNPLLDLPLWALAQVAPGWVCGAALGALQGLNFSLLYLLARDGLQLPWRRGLAFALALVGVSGAFALSLLGTTSYDNVLSLALLAGLWLLLRPGAGLGHAAAAAALAGISVGLKLPAAPFGLAMLAAIACRMPTPELRWRGVLIGGIAAALGLLLTAGWWFWRLWQDTGNPIFPYFNQLIGSSLILDASYRDTRFLPQGVFEVLLFPLRFALDWQVAADGPISDWRIALAYVVALATLPLWLARRRSASAWFSAQALRVLMAFAATAYVSWLAVFGIYRYITVLEMLAPLLTLALIGSWPLPAAARAWGGAGLLLAMLLLTRVDFSDRVPFTGDFIEVTPPAIPRPEASLALMTGIEPMAYVIPSYPASIPFLRIDGWLVGPERDTPLLRRMRERIERHLDAGGDLYTLFASYERERGDAALARLGLQRSGRCQYVRGNLGPPLNWCPVQRRGRETSEP